jgi:hypothetical protein
MGLAEATATILLLAGVSITLGANSPTTNGLRNAWNSAVADAAH